MAEKGVKGEKRKWWNKVVAGECADREDGVSEWSVARRETETAAVSE